MCMYIDHEGFYVYRMCVYIYEYICIYVYIYIVRVYVYIQVYQPQIRMLRAAAGISRKAFPFGRGQQVRRAPISAGTPGIRSAPRARKSI